MSVFNFSKFFFSKS